MRITSPYIERIAQDFWKQTGQQWIAPYDINCAVSLLLPIDIVSLCELSLEKVDQWLSQRGIKIPIDINDRYLHGFVLVSQGNGFIFINGTDTEEERRYTVAHEVSHFILDYKILRDEAVRKLGTVVLDVLDGLREPTVEERISGLLKDVIVRPFTHLLEKEGDGSFKNSRIFDSENRADTLALELLAPHDEITHAILKGNVKISFPAFHEKCIDLLVNKYRLPLPIAEQYSKRLAYSVTGGPSIINKLGF
ncbi:MAG: ImmA/IrrE family metallo-endopeptidase [Flavisolibacter sp.]